MRSGSHSGFQARYGSPRGGKECGSIHVMPNILGITNYIKVRSVLPAGYATGLRCDDQDYHRKHSAQIPLRRALPPRGPPTPPRARGRHAGSCLGPSAGLLGRSLASDRAFRWPVRSPSRGRTDSTSPSRSTHRLDAGIPQCPRIAGNDRRRHAREPYPVIPLRRSKASGQ